MALVGADGELQARVGVRHRQHLRAAPLADAEHAQQHAGASETSTESRVTDEGATPGGSSSMWGPLSVPDPIATRVPAA